MGDILNEFVIFLEEYYVYVIGVGLILVLMLIGLLASRKKAKKQAKVEEPMANINEVNTGSINDVADTIANDAMQPTDVVTFTEDKSSDNQVASEELAMPEIATSPIVENIATPINEEVIVPTEETTPLSDEVAPINTTQTDVVFNEEIANPSIESNVDTMAFPAVDEETNIPTMNAVPNQDIVTEINEAPIVETPSEDSLTDTTIVKPIVEEDTMLEEITPVEEDRFDQTEVIDFSTATAETPEDIKPVEAQPFVIDSSQFNNSSNGLDDEKESDDFPKV